MKKALIFCLAVLLALSVCACSSKEDTSTYTVGNYTVDQANGTISDGTYTYRFTFSGDSSDYDVEITYPDGSAYWWHHQSGSGGISFGGGGWSDDYDPDRYVSGDVLCDVIVAGAPSPRREGSPGMTLFAIVMLVVGLFNIFSPQTAWYLRDGWKFRDAEPSDTALGLTRAGGAFAVVIAVVLFLAGL